MAHTLASTRVRSRELTIVTVSFGDRRWIERGADLAERLNPGHGARWRLVVNEPAQPEDRAGDPGRFELLRGGALTEQERADRRSRSLHHAKGLHAGLRDVGTRWVLLLDSDCFIVRPGWMEDVLAHMDDVGLAFLGTPYHPRGTAKLRYFPTCVCLFVDLTRVPVAALDFTPGTDEPSPGRVERVANAFLARRGMHDRVRFERSQDTGVRVYRRYRDDPVAPSECVVPVVTAGEARTVLRRPSQLVLEKVLPDRWCLLPRRPGYFTDVTFAQLGAPDFYAHGAEEYLWRGAPFAAHLRGSERLRTDDAGLDRVLAGFEGAAALVR